MATKSQSRRAPTTPKMLQTPKRKTKGAQQAVLDNFDLEGE